jgi:3-methyladenine DNA glycosylase/8-oxoguanine DNA glycosylase
MTSRHTTLYIDVKAPFALKATALAHGWHECAPMSWCEGGRCLQVVERAAGRPYRVSITEGKRTTRKASLRVTVHDVHVDESLAETVTRNVRIMLGLDRDLAEFYEICSTHPTLKVLARIGAGRSIRSVSMTENIIKALCATNVNWTQAVKMINRMGQLGPPIRHHVNLTAWPTPREILRAGKAYLEDVCRLGYRAESVLMFCRDVCERRADPEILTDLANDPDVPSDLILSRLRSIRGIGPSSAHYLLSFLGRNDCISVDSATIAHVARTHMRGRKPTRKQIDQIYEGYGRWKNSVWWFEHWLGWATAQDLLRDAGVGGETASAPGAGRP